MIEANKNEFFPISATVTDEEDGVLVAGKTVIYDIRTITDSQLVPPINGILQESAIEAGIYRTEVSIPSDGSYVCYVTCSGFLTNVENIIVNQENIYEITKENRSYNTSVIDVVRTTISGSETASQLSRNVPMNKTDYIITYLKLENDNDWSNPVSSGISYAHYESIDSSLPYKMGALF